MSFTDIPICCVRHLECAENLSSNSENGRFESSLIIIVYSVDEVEKRVVVHAVWHKKRGHFELKERLSSK